MGCQINAQSFPFTNYFLYAYVLHISIKDELTRQI